MSKVVLKGYIIVPTDELSVIKEALKVHIELTRKEAGCIVFSVVQSQENPQRFDVYEEYIDMPSFELHQKRVKQSRWGEITVNVQRHYQLIKDNP